MECLILTCLIFFAAVSAQPPVVPNYVGRTDVSAGVGVIRGAGSADIRDIALLCSDRRPSSRYCNVYTECPNNGRLYRCEPYSGLSSWSGICCRTDSGLGMTGGRHTGTAVAATRIIDRGISSVDMAARGITGTRQITGVASLCYSGETLKRDISGQFYRCSRMYTYCPGGTDVNCRIPPEESRGVCCETDRTVIGTRVVGGEYTGPGGSQRIVNGRLITGTEPVVRDVIRRGGVVSTGIVDNTGLAGGVVPRLDPHDAADLLCDDGSRAISYCVHFSQCPPDGAHYVYRCQPNRHLGRIGSVSGRSGLCCRTSRATAGTTGIATGVIGERIVTGIDPGVGGSSIITRSGRIGGAGVIDGIDPGVGGSTIITGIDPGVGRSSITTGGRTIAGTGVGISGRDRRVHVCHSLGEEPKFHSNGEVDICSRQYTHCPGENVNCRFESPHDNRGICCERRLTGGEGRVVSGHNPRMHGETVCYANSELPKFDHDGTLVRCSRSSPYCAGHDTTCRREAGSYWGTCCIINPNPGGTSGTYVGSRTGTVVS